MLRRLLFFRCPFLSSQIRHATRVIGAAPSTDLSTSSRKKALKLQKKQEKDEPSPAPIVPESDVDFGRSDDFENPGAYSVPIALDPRFVFPRTWTESGRPDADFDQWEDILSVAFSDSESRGANMDVLEKEELIGIVVNGFTALGESCRDLKEVYLDTVSIMEGNGESLYCRENYLALREIVDEQFGVTADHLSSLSYEELQKRTGNPMADWRVAAHGLKAQVQIMALGEEDVNVEKELLSEWASDRIKELQLNPKEEEGGEPIELALEDERKWVRHRIVKEKARAGTVLGSLKNEMTSSKMPPSLPKLNEWFRNLMKTSRAADLCRLYEVDVLSEPALDKHFLEILQEAVIPKSPSVSVAEQAVSAGTATGESDSPPPPVRPSVEIPEWIHSVDEKRGLLLALAAFIVLRWLWSFRNARETARRLKTLEKSSRFMKNELSDVKTSAIEGMETTTEYLWIGLAMGCFFVLVDTLKAVKALWEGL